MRKLLILGVLLFCSISTYAQSDKVVDYGKNLFKAMIENDSKLFFANYTNKTFKFSDKAQSYSKGINQANDFQKRQMVKALSEKLKKNVRGNVYEVKLKYLVITETNITENEVMGTMAFLYGNSTDTYQFYLMVYKKTKDDLLFAVRESNVQKINLEDKLEYFNNDFDGWKYTSEFKDTEVYVVKVTE